MLLKKRRDEKLLVNFSRLQEWVSQSLSIRIGIHLCSRRLPNVKVPN